MTPQEAIALLDAADSSNEPSAVNPSMTKAQAIEIIRAGVKSPRALQADGVTLDPLFEKRVHQVTKNQKRPRY